MSGDLSGFEKLKNDEIWKKYTFEEDPNEASDKNNLFPICEENSVYGRTPKEYQKKACKKLLKNWHLLRSTIRNPSNQNEWCNNINNWIYYEINPYSLNDDNIKIILQEAQPTFIHMPNKEYCPFTDLNVNHEPKELNKLRIFNEHTSTFKDILTKKSSDYYCSCRNFIKDCINIYRTLQNKHCNTTINNDNRVTCNILKNFNIFYGGFLYNAIGTQENLPDLSATTDININNEECRSQANAKALGSVHGDQMDSSTVSTTPTKTAGKTMPTAIGTIAGVSSVLALLYKVITIFYLNM
ncbi:hypothetical protein PVBG_05193 [Plasmodium vivax Brazil I]|uniref:Uncharacterized protein n=1 Tax=Plasmodium vivax (strain Brazil I) TaxID=1033975 RepID=A0A0J9VAT8_PLAV1|nr:hypothetical protein PVBG_05193 [Plasmodium vivax Brazil I]